MSLKTNLKILPIVIVNWNGTKDTIECITSVEASTYKNWRIVLVDNNSSVHEIEMLKSFISDKKQISLIQNDKNIGFAKANNQAIRYCDENLDDWDCCFLLNNDTTIAKDCLAKVYSHFQSRSLNLVSTKMVLYDNRNILDNVGHKMLNTGEIIPIGHKEAVLKYVTESENLGPCGGACLISRALIKDIGLFDDYFSTGYEDAELGLRSYISGYTSGYCPEAIVYHKKGMAIKKVFDSKYAIRTQINILYTYFKLMPITLVVLNLPFMVIRYLLIILASILLLRWKYASIIAKAIWQFLTVEIKTVIQKRREFYTKIDSVSNLKILQKQEFFLKYDLNRSWKYLIERQPSALDTY